MLRVPHSKDTPTMRPGMPKTEHDQERIIMALEQIMRELHAINGNLTVVARAMKDSSYRASLGVNAASDSELDTLLKCSVELPREE